jgi:hypothetical protein
MHGQSVTKQAKSRNAAKTSKVSNELQIEDLRDMHDVESVRNLLLSYNCSVMMLTLQESEISNNISLHMLDKDKVLHGDTFQATDDVADSSLSVTSTCCTGKINDATSMKGPYPFSTFVGLDRCLSS